VINEHMSMQSDLFYIHSIKRYWIDVEDGHKLL